MTNKPKKPLWVIGIDEVGRGPLAGPVTVCAVAVPYRGYSASLWPGLTDSKKMTAPARAKWYKEALRLERSGILRYALSSRSAQTIDTKGIAPCIRECIVSILKKIALPPEECLVLLDGGLKAPAQYAFQQTIIKGDSKEPVISYASVIAKVHRDMYMTKAHRKNPEYGWDKNKGYGTQDHQNTLIIQGVTALHRKSFLRRILDK
ncbi:MAG TPA: ribonuclease HII [Candidatus Paceibacterota bacterium]